jgi:hypothetical protein
VARLRNGGKTSFSESCHPFVYCIYPAIKFAKNLLFILIIKKKRAETPLIPQ